MVGGYDRKTPVHLLVGLLLLDGCDIFVLLAPALEIGL
jgi:hypothetical protein